MAGPEESPVRRRRTAAAARRTETVGQRGAPFQTLIQRLARVARILGQYR